MEVRKFGDGDREALKRLLALSFGDSLAEAEGDLDPERNSRLDPDRLYVVEEDGEPRATAAVFPLEVFVDGRAAPMGGVSAVATHPAYRRRGYARELMKLALREMREREVHLSMLSPFSHAFYRVHGYELATEAIEYNLKPTDLPTSPEQKRVRAYREGDLPQMMALHDGKAAEHPCCVRRSERRWREYMGREDKEATIYEREGRVEGYLLYEMSGWESPIPARTLKELELVWETPDSRAALISFLAAQDPLVFGIRYWTLRGEPLHPYLQSSYVETKIAPDQMLRLVDVEGALGLLDRRISAPLTLDVSDDAIPENAGVYTAGGGEAVRGAEAGERASLDVRQLAQLYAGYLPARQLARHGLVETSSTEALELLEELFPPGDPWVFGPDHF